MEAKERLEVIKTAWVDTPEIEPMFLAAQKDIAFLYEQITSAKRLLGWAQFNLGKGKTGPTHTLIDKALVALGSEPFYERES